jgi:hypothetical protein
MLRKKIPLSLVKWKVPTTWTLRATSQDDHDNGTVFWLYCIVDITIHSERGLKHPTIMKNYLNRCSKKKFDILYYNKTSCYFQLMMLKSKYWQASRDNAASPRSTQKEAVWDHYVERLFQQYFSDIVAVGFIGGGNRSTKRKPLICRKSLTNITT